MGTSIEICDGDIVAPGADGKLGVNVCEVGVGDEDPSPG